MANVPKSKLTEQEYLQLERSTETRSEFYRGEMFAMSGASRQHNLISGNIFSWIHQQFAGRPCEVYQNDMRVKVSSTGLYTYPDVVATCEQPVFEDAAVDTLLNPMVIVEVSSKSTEIYDRREKFAHYKTLDSLKAYILVSQSEPLVERYLPQSDGQWLVWTGSHLDDQLIIPCIDCTLKLSNVYARIEFQQPDQRQIREPEASDYLANRPAHPDAHLHASQ